MIDTIVAIATPRGRGGIGIIRLSGPEAKLLAEKVTHIKLEPRKIQFTQFYNEQNDVLDHGVTLYFKAPNSFTGEDVVELQGHGSPVMLNHLVDILTKAGARLAQPGEFSKRAFLNDKIDLVQAEAIADLIDASSLQAAKSAMLTLQGVFSEKIQALLDDLINLRVYVEAAIDFPEEEIDFLSDGKIQTKLENILQHLLDIEKTAAQGLVLHDGMTVVIAGKPNAGKSSLLNALSLSERAIVTPIAGTTRDIIRENIQIDGMPLHVIDTAGLRESNDPVEQEGIKRALSAIEEADEVLLVCEENETDPFSAWPSFAKKPSAFTIIKNKIDLTETPAKILQNNGETLIYLSAKSGDGVDLLRQHLKNKMGYQLNDQTPFTARKRHLLALEKARLALENGLHQLIHFRAGECLAEELRLAQLNLSEITGQFTNDDLLGHVFSSFCIGK